MRVRRTRSIFLFAALLLLPLVIAGSWGRAQEAQTSKGPDVITVGTGPYTGPTSAELAKLAALEGGPGGGVPPAKAPETATISPGGGNTLTPEEQAKLQTLLQTLPPPDMIKLPAMVVPKDGIPEMTAQELQKLAQMRAQGSDAGTPTGEAGGSISGSTQTDAPTPAADEGAAPKDPTDPTAPTAPDKAPRHDR